MMYLKGIERPSLIGMERSFILKFIGREGNLLSQDFSGGLDMLGQGFSASHSKQYNLLQ